MKKHCRLLVGKKAGKMRWIRDTGDLNREMGIEKHFQFDCSDRALMDQAVSGEAECQTDRLT
jgi:hypothetical protein